MLELPQLPIFFLILMRLLAAGPSFHAVCRLIQKGRPLFPVRCTFLQIIPLNGWSYRNLEVPGHTLLLIFVCFQSIISRSRYNHDQPLFDFETFQRSNLMMQVQYHFQGIKGAKFWKLRIKLRYIRACSWARPLTVFN